MQQFETPISEFLDGTPAVSISHDVSVADAIDKMTKENSEYLLVLENDRVVGIFTQRDFLNRVVGERRIPADTPLREVMTAEPETLRPHHNIAYAVERMANRSFRNIPIIDEGSAPAVLSIWHVLNNLPNLLSKVEENGVDLPDEWTDIGGG